MDIATIAGLVAGLALILGTIILGGGLIAFINIPSLMVTIGGALSATFICYPLSKMLVLVKVVMQTVFNSTPTLDSTLDQLLEFADLYRTDGPKAVEKILEKIKYPFIQKALVLVDEGNKSDEINFLLKREIANFKERHKVGQNILSSLGTYAPAFGMIGTLIGLIQMLRNLPDPTQIGYGMSVALLTTFYGAVFANLVCSPLATKLKERSREEAFVCELVREGIVAIVDGEKKRAIQHKLVTFMNQKSRQKYEK